MKCRFSSLFSISLVLAFGCVTVWAQATAQISGTVTDATGALIPGVEVTATKTDTDAPRTVLTNETGSYILPALPLGPYQLEAVLPGFQTFLQTGIVLQVNATPVINVVLEVGQVTQTIEVQANAALVETRAIGVGEIIENERILELPLNGRSVVELIALAGGVAPAATLTGSRRDPFARGNVSVAGGLNSALNYTLDGANHNNPFQGSYLSMPFPDAMQEFKVETSATSATGGVKSAGTVSLVTKSGTNEFHGNLFEFVRNGKFNARGAFEDERDTIKRNQFGGTIGGPIVPNKLFFFAGYQGTRIRQDPAAEFAFVPTQAMLAGDFRDFAGAGCNRRAVTLDAPFVNNQIDPALFSPAAVKFASFLQSSNDPCGEVSYGDPLHDDFEAVIGRLDYQVTNNHSLFARYLYESRLVPTGFDLNQNLFSVNNGADAQVQAFTLGSTYLIGANIVNSFRITGNDLDGGKTGPDFSNCNCGNGLLGIKSFFMLPETPNIDVDGGFDVGTAVGPMVMNMFAFNDDLSVISGDHQLGFGVSSAWWWIDSASTANNSAPFTFNGQTTGLGLADFLLGRASRLRIGAPIEQHNRSKYFNMYYSDTWRMTQNLTLNYGVRWEPFFPQVNTDGTSIHYSEADMLAGVQTARFINAPPGLSFDGDPGFPDGQGQNNQWKNFSPRVGLAWDVAGDGRTSVRASLGTFYDYPAAIYQRSLTTVPPWNNRIQLDDIDWEDPWADHPGGDPGLVPFGGGVPVDLPWTNNGIATGMDFDTPNMKVAQWNLSVQRQFGNEWMVQANYIGNTTRHLWGTQHINPVIFVPGNGDANGNCFLNGATVNFTVRPGRECSSRTTSNRIDRRSLAIFPIVPKSISEKYGIIGRIDSGGTASYNGLVLSLQRRPVSGISFNMNYTWSHCITDPQQDVVNGGNADNGWIDANNRRFGRGDCSVAARDTRHLFNLSGVAASPEFNNRALQVIASGWQLSPILRINTGRALTVTNRRDPARNFMRDQRPNVVLDNVYGDKNDPSNYLNPDAFETPAHGTLGNLGAGAIRGPGRWGLDVALSRSFQLSEAQRLEFRAEAFNLTNSTRFDAPQLRQDRSNTFGQIRGAEDPRIMQFALKFIF